MSATSKRTVPMRVLVLSPPRSGTRSMYLALRTLLQEDVYHGFETMENKPPGRTWIDWVNAKYEGTGNLPGRDAFDFGLGNYAGVTDMPCCFFWRELMDAYPEAKVVLVNRDFDAWWKSFYSAIPVILFHPLTWLVRQLEPFMGTYTATFSQKVVLGYFGITSVSQLTKEKAREVIERHYADIRKACEPTPGRLLEMRIDEGWDPLAKHLGMKKPDVPFPRSNEVAELDRITSAHRKAKILEGAVALVKVCSPLLVAGGAGLWYLLR